MGTAPIFGRPHLCSNTLDPNRSPGSRPWVTGLHESVARTARPFGARRGNGFVASILPGKARMHAGASGARDGGGVVPDCRTCSLRPSCISYGWKSPAGLWFENMVVLRPTPGCRGYVGRGADILDHFGETDEAAPGA